MQHLFEPLHNIEAHHIHVHCTLAIGVQVVLRLIKWGCMHAGQHYITRTICIVTRGEGWVTGYLEEGLTTVFMSIH